MRTSCGQGPQISGLVISNAVLPAAKHDANPFEGQGSDYGMVVLTTLALLLVIGTRPNRLRNRVSCPFVKTLPQKLGTRPAKVHPFLLSTAIGGDRDAGPQDRRGSGSPSRLLHFPIAARSWGSVGAALAAVTRTRRVDVVAANLSDNESALASSKDLLFSGFGLFRDYVG
jgi:hypothetical protein